MKRAVEPDEYLPHPRRYLIFAVFKDGLQGIFHRKQPLRTVMPCSIKNAGI